ncbi:MAG: aldo/keto reductase, partial [Oscillospiraceae bacterium]|nr:aldo/keto reductase [Oscillospiraceae bacterium]
MSDYFGKEIPKLGFGLMRLPKKVIGTDIEQTKLMVDRFMNAGFTYFDTAYTYIGSEEAAKKYIVERYQREDYTLATKLNVFMMAPNEKAAKNQFYT